jgi:hypothetical protein
MTLEKVNEKIDEITRLIKDPHLAEGSASTWSRISGYEIQAY